nr:aminotransferase class V-fold PLP-dependent enzyme [Sphingomonas daechungensis]
MAGRQGYDVTRLPVGSEGLLDLDDVKAAVDENVAIVAVMLVNNEIGVIQPIGEISRLAHEFGALMLCDAVQGLAASIFPKVRTSSRSRLTRSTVRRALERYG